MQRLRDFRHWEAGVFVVRGKVERLPKELCPPRTTAQLLHELVERAPNDAVPVWIEFGRASSGSYDKKIRGWKREAYERYAKPKVMTAGC